MRTSRWLFLLFLVLAGVSRLEAQTDQVIYDNSLENGWQDWGWASHNYANKSPVHAGQDSVILTCGSYEALYIDHDAFDSSPYTNLVFWANGGTSGGQALAVCAHMNGNPTAWLILNPLPANAWTNIVIPLSALGAVAAPALDGFWFGNAFSTPLPTLYLDDISLQAGGPPGLNATNSIVVDVGAARHPISPLIYGTAFATSNQLADLNFTMNRSGGNEESTYNWQINAHNKAADWYYESYPDDSSVAGESADSVVANSEAAGAEALITVPMMNWTPKLGSGRAILPAYSTSKYGAQTSTDPYLSTAGNGVSSSSNSPITWNDPNDAYIPADTNFEKGYVQHLTGKWGVSTNGGVKYYIMDNEHSIWHSTHQDIHPVGATMQEILDKMIAYATMVKSVDPNALVAGPEEWGWPGYLYSGYDQQWSGQHNDYNAAHYPDRKTNGGWDYMPWLLSQLYKHDTNSGVRLLDYFTLHCYPQEGNVGGSATDSSTQTLRNQSTRQFWDPNYVDPSWINSVILLIPRMMYWVSTNYPGTKIGVTEYNWGAEGFIGGATAQADLLGIFGREGLDLATRWTTPSASTPTYLAMKIYRNYDGNHSTFGDMNVLASGPNPDKMAVFAAQRSSDSALTIMVVSKYLTGTAPVNISLTNFNAGGAVQVWQLNSSNVIAQLPSIAVQNNSLATVVPGQSVTLFILPAQKSISLAPGVARGDGQFEFFVSGQTGQSFTLQSSGDLLHWSTVSSNIFSNAPTQFLLPAANASLFYRAIATE